jgi:hypothetical protein
VFYDRYKGCKIPFYRFRGQEKHGIFVRDEEFHDDITITFADCVAEVARVDWGYHEILNEHRFEVKDFGFAAYTRRVNHVVAYLDKVTIYDRILQNDVSIIDLLDGFTSAQIAEFTDFASKNDRTECTALLMQYQNAHYGDFDPMAEFLLEL